MPSTLSQLPKSIKHVQQHQSNPQLITTSSLGHHRQMTLTKNNSNILRQAFSMKTTFVVLGINFRTVPMIRLIVVKTFSTALSIGISCSTNDCKFFIGFESE
jgi:hypothetical protein